ncbi:putative ribonuclease H-like domain-containing protein [Tanacetum coccineum]
MTKNKRGFGYNAVPSPHPLILNRPTPLDLSYSGLEEFQQPEINWYGPRDSISCQSTVCDRDCQLSLKKNTVTSNTNNPSLHLKTISDVPTLSGMLKALFLETLLPLDFKEFDGGFVTFGGVAMGGESWVLTTLELGKVKGIACMLGVLVNKHMLEGTGPSGCVFESNISSQKDQDCIFMPIWKDASYFEDITPQSVDDVLLQGQDGNHDDSSFQDDVNTGSRELSTADYAVNSATSEGLMGPIPTTEDSQQEDQGIELGNLSPSYAVSTTPHTRIHKDHPIDHVIGDVQSSVQTRRMTTSYSELGFLSAIYEGKTHQDLHTCLFAGNAKRNSYSSSYKMNKARLVAQGHTQEEGIDYDEVFAPVARIEAIRIFLAYASFMGFTVYQLMSKGFLIWSIEEEVYGVVNLLGLKDRPSLDQLCEEFDELMKDKFQMSSMGDLPFFGGCKFKDEKGIFISQDKYVHEILKKFNYTDVKSASTPTDLERPLVKDSDADDVDEHLYRSMIGSFEKNGILHNLGPDIMFCS